MQKLNEPFREKDMFGDLFFSTVWEKKIFFPPQFLVDILPLVSYPWIRIILRIRIQESKMLHSFQ